MKPTIMNSSYLRNPEGEEKEKESLTQQFNSLLEENQKLIKIIEQKNAELAKHKAP